MIKFMERAFILRVELASNNYRNGFKARKDLSEKERLALFVLAQEAISTCLRKCQRFIAFVAV